MPLSRSFGRSKASEGAASRCTACREGRLILRCTTPRPGLSDLVSRPRRWRGLPPPPRSPVVAPCEAPRETPSRSGHSGRPGVRPGLRLDGLRFFFWAWTFAARCRRIIPVPERQQMPGARPAGRWWRGGSIGVKCRIGRSLCPEPEEDGGWCKCFAGRKSGAGRGEPSGCCSAPSGASHPRPARHRSVVGRYAAFIESINNQARVWGRRTSTRKTTDRRKGMRDVPH